MRKLCFAIFSFALISFGCGKTSFQKPSRDPINEPPTIKVINPTTAQLLKPFDQLNVKAIFTDIDIVAVASWEAIDAAIACGPNQYKGTFSPNTYEYEMNFLFTIPPQFPGPHIIRLYGVDASGNIGTADIHYTSTY